MFSEVRSLGFGVLQHNRLNQRFRVYGKSLEEFAEQAEEKLAELFPELSFSVESCTDQLIHIIGVSSDCEQKLTACAYPNSEPHIVEN